MWGEGRKAYLRVGGGGSYLGDDHLAKYGPELLGTGENIFLAGIKPSGLNYIFWYSGWETCRLLFCQTSPLTPPPHPHFPPLPTPHPNPLYPSSRFPHTISVHSLSKPHRICTVVSVWNWITGHWNCSCEGEKVRGALRLGIHHNLARDGFIESSAIGVSKEISLVMVYSALFNNAFKALNLFLNK